jgi:hypothetical protein
VDTADFSRVEGQSEADGEATGEICDHVRKEHCIYEFDEESESKCE